jgi:3-hydroxybutyryl-CoA dehydrogenase
MQIPIDRIAVIGAGTMGRGIIETAVVHGLTVLAVEVNAAQRDAAREQIAASIARGVERGKLNLADPAEPVTRIQWADTLDAAAAADFVIEAVAEEEGLKTEIFQQLDDLCPDRVVLASNTSSISITRLAAATGRGDRVVGMHFFNPVPVMQPVEIVAGEQTSADTVALTRKLAERMGKQAFVVRDRPGFVVNRVLMPLINEAAYLVEEGVADAQTIDGLMKLGCNHPMGPLTLADLIGLDVCLSILQVLHRELDESPDGAKFRPCPLLVELVESGRLGRKTGRGFYEYGH